MPRTSLVFARIRDLLAERPRYPYELWRSGALGSVPYHRVLYYMWVLEQLGLVEVAREEPSSRGGYPKRFYRIRAGVDLEDPRWFRAQQALYPDTALGRRYARYKAAGLTGRGRDEAYRR